MISTRVGMIARGSGSKELKKVGIKTNKWEQGAQESGNDKQEEVGARSTRKWE
jgi:hypothetical protein